MKRKKIHSPPTKQSTENHCKSSPVSCSKKMKWIKWDKKELKTFSFLFSLPFCVHHFNERARMITSIYSENEARIRRRQEEEEKVRPIVWESSMNEWGKSFPILINFCAFLSEVLTSKCVWFLTLVLVP